MNTLRGAEAIYKLFDQVYKDAQNEELSLTLATKIQRLARALARNAQTKGNKVRAEQLEKYINAAAEAGDLDEDWNRTRLYLMRGLNVAGVLVSQEKYLAKKKSAKSTTRQSRLSPADAAAGHQRDFLMLERQTESFANDPESINGKDMLKYYNIARRLGDKAYIRAYRDALRIANTQGEEGRGKIVQIFRRVATTPAGKATTLPAREYQKLKAAFNSINQRMADGRVPLNGVVKVMSMVKRVLGSGAHKYADIVTDRYGKFLTELAKDRGGDTGTANLRLLANHKAAIYQAMMALSHDLRGVSSQKSSKSRTKAIVQIAVDFADTLSDLRTLEKKYRSLSRNFDSAEYERLWRYAEQTFDLFMRNAIRSEAKPVATEARQLHREMVQALDKMTGKNIPGELAMIAALKAKISQLINKLVKHYRSA